MHYFKKPGLSTNNDDLLISKVKGLQKESDISVETELCYNVSINSILSETDKNKLVFLLSECFQEGNLSEESWLEISNNCILEFGPRLNFATSFSTNAVSICHGIGLKQISRIELSRRYALKISDCNKSEDEVIRDMSGLLHDKMTEMRYKKSLESFSINIDPEEVYEINIMKEGKKALECANTKMGLALDEWDLDYYTNLFKNKLKRNPTNVECFDLAQSNSEHCRHWFFKGKMILDGEEMDKCLMELVCDTQKTTNDNNIIKFSDNSSAIKGYKISTLTPEDPASASSYEKRNILRHILLTAETHNFPTGVAPFPGATTGTGGRIRDTHAAGIGSHVVAGTAGYCFGNLHIPGYDLPWEENFKYPHNFALPLEVAIEASNGASDYGNKFGEPVICGFARSFGMLLPDYERREWIKPIMFSGGIGSIDGDHVSKKHPQIGMKVLKVGGPVYRIGVGGGAASSIQVQGDNAEELDFGAVQRGDAEMEQKLNRLIRACIEMRENNPICSIHDQGAGGNGNVLKEICEPAGALIKVSQFQLGDPTLSVLEIWGAEYQESDAILIEEKNVDILKKIGEREKVEVSFVGDITGDGRVVLEDTRGCKDIKNHEKEMMISKAVDLPLDVVLGKMPPKTYHLKRKTKLLSPVRLQPALTVRDALERVLRLPSVASKRYLTNKVDRSVTGLIAQQQCVGPLHTPLADVAVTALSHFDTVGAATSIGEQPIKMLVDEKKGARLTVAEAFTNLMFASVTDIKDVKCSANWMWPAKLDGEGARMFEACKAMSDMLSSLGAAVDGGKDSLSMAARVEKDVVKAPGALVISLYAPCPDIRKTVTPDLKFSGNSLIYVKMSGNDTWKVGGSALAQVFNQIGDDVPDIDDSEFARSFTAIQSLVDEKLLESGHDVSDGGLVTTLLEMSFAGNLGFSVQLDEMMMKPDDNVMHVLFAEEPGAILEVSDQHVDTVLVKLKDSHVPCFKIGHVTETDEVVLTVRNETILRDKVSLLRSVWEETSFQLEYLQCNPVCVKEEEDGLKDRRAPDYQTSFFSKPAVLTDSLLYRPKVAVLREEGSNGDREMASSLYMAGFNVFDVNMQDLCGGDIDFTAFQGLVFVGGFSYADVFGSAKGWAASCRFNAVAQKQLEAFRQRDDTFSLGVCNGCQLMSLLGWVGGKDGEVEQSTCFTHNTSGRFESRFVNVKITESPSIMLKGMEGSVMGVWVAHGEGRMQPQSEEHLAHLLGNNLAPIRYVNDLGEVTQRYPLNPNGSVNGIAGLCSSDGRHLAMMPHPERCTLMWQWPWLPKKFDSSASPWLQMFHNAFKWCAENKKET